jgi:hypothetical protein
MTTEQEIEEAINRIADEEQETCKNYLLVKDLRYDGLVSQVQHRVPAASLGQILAVLDRIIQKEREWEEKIHASPM